MVSRLPYSTPRRLPVAPENILKTTDVGRKNWKARGPGFYNLGSTAGRVSDLGKIPSHSEDQFPHLQRGNTATGTCQDPFLRPGFAGPLGGCTWICTCPSLHLGLLEHTARSPPLLTTLRQERAPLANLQKVSVQLRLKARLYQTYVTAQQFCKLLPSIRTSFVIYYI